MSGFFITFEGGEGAGKSTLIEKVYSTLKEKGVATIKTHAPGATQLGKGIRELLLHQKETRITPRSELLLFLADRAEHVNEIILPALKKEIIVLCDRFNDSTIAYQAGARGLNEETVRQLCHFAAQGLEPNLTLYLDIDPVIGLKRIPAHGDRIESETLDFHQKIRKTFLKIADEEPARVRTIDASAPLREVFAQALEQIDVLLAHR
jgi:dTMP kinase